jgi:biopolymer transport protein ExbB/TolQ
MLQKSLTQALAVFLWVACAFELLMLSLSAIRGTLAQSGFFGQLLAQQGAGNRMAPLAVLVVLAGVLIQVVVCTLRIAREQAALSGLKGDAGAGMSKVAPQLRAGRRAQLLIRYAAAPAKLAETLPATAALDAVELENGYGTLKALVWTLPVLGFIGTAWGMSHAIAGFSEALKASAGQSVQIELMTDRLAQVVIPGLANAFAVTMLALGASIVAHFWTATLQSWDQDVLGDLDRVCIQKLGEAMPAKGAGNVPRELLSLLADQLAQVAGQLAELTRKLDLADAADYLKQAAAAHTAAAQQVSRAATEMQHSVQAPYHITISRDQVQ